MHGTKPKHTEKRIYPRFELDARIAVTGTREGKKTECRGRTVDVSENGVSAALSAHLIAGETVIVEFRIGAHAPHIVTRAVIRQRRDFVYGIEFLGLSSEQRALIREAAKTHPVLR
jgi:PilZ domain-containing protein